VIGPQQIGQAYLAGALWWYAGSVLYPARALKRAGVSVVGEPVGDEPEGLPRPGLGPHFSVGAPPPVLLAGATEHDHLVEEFDRMAEVYDLVVKPFSTPIFDEALATLGRFLAPDCRILDTGCGPGRELRRLARLVPEGEAVGVDLAAGMVNVADAAARAAGLDNCAFFQADVGDLPRSFTGKFDLVYNSLAHHHYPDPAAAAASVLRCLRPGGIYCVVDPGPAWFNTLSAPVARRTDPGWIGFHTPERFRELLGNAGFARTWWVPLLPGFGAAIGQKAYLARRTRAGSKAA
jgi:SAM-dependent methyltransferase